MGVPGLKKSAEALTFLSHWDDLQKPQGASEADFEGAQVWPTSGVAGVPQAGSKLMWAWPGLRSQVPLGLQDKLMVVNSENIGGNAF